MLSFPLSHIEVFDWVLEKTVHSLTNVLSMLTLTAGDVTDNPKNRLIIFVVAGILTLLTIAGNTALGVMAFTEKSVSPGAVKVSASRM